MAGASPFPIFQPFRLLVVYIVSIFCGRFNSHCPAVQVIPDFDQALIERHMANYSDGWWAGGLVVEGEASLKVFQELVQVPRCVDSGSSAMHVLHRSPALNGSWEDVGRAKIYTFDIWARDIMQNDRSFWYHFGRWFAGHNSLIHLLGCSIDPIDGILVVQVCVHSMKGIIFVAQMLKRQKAHYQLSTNPSFSKGPGFIHIYLTKLTCSDIPICHIY